MMTANVSPLRYPGGKTRACKIIEKVIIEHLDIRLFNFLKDEKRNWVLTYNNCAFIRDLYKDFTIIDVNWKYGMNTSKQSSEIIIINYIRITSII